MNKMNVGFQEMVEMDRRYREFLCKYYDMYPACIREKLPRNLFEYRPTDGIYDFMWQIFVEIGFFSGVNNSYLAYFNLMKEHHDLGVNILEIGCGCFPTFSKYIDLEQQKIGRGTITACDPILVVTKLGRIKLMRSFLDATIDIRKFDMVVAVNPHDATKIAIERPIKANKDLFLVFCNCPPEEEEKKYSSPQSWQCGLINYARAISSSDCEFRVLGIDEKHGVSSPVLSISQEPSSHVR